MHLLMTNYITFSTSTALVRIPAEAVVYISADGNYSSIVMVDGNEYMLTMQLGQIERYLEERIDRDNNQFIRIGKSLIINRSFITFINPARKKLTLSDCHTFKYDVTASSEALKALKDFIEKEETL